MTPHEDRNFFIRQYLKTMPLNFLSMGIKALNGVAWTILDNASILGFFSLASTPSAISQRAMTAGLISQTVLPATKNRDQDEAIIQTAIVIDVALVLVFSLGLAVFYFFSHARIVGNLGLLFYIVVSLLSTVEGICGGAINYCNAKRHYVWNFILNNIRPVLWLIMISVLWQTHTGTPSSGAWLWILSCVGALVLSIICLAMNGIRLWPVNRDPIRITFAKNLFDNVHHLIVFKFSALLFGSLISLFISFLDDTHQVGLFSFAMTLSGFMYAAIAPINEQIYSPTISRLVNENNPRLLNKRLAQMSILTLGVVILASVCLLWGGRPLLQIIHKIGFIDSFLFLPALLGYQGIILVGAGFSYALFSMNRFKALTFSQGIGFVSALIWYLIFRGQLRLSILCFPIAAAVYTILNISYVLLLSSRDAPLLRRSMM